MPPMQPEEVVAELNRRFDSNEYIDLTTSTSVTISGNSTLENFFLGEDNQTLGDIVENGVRFLRIGFYKLVGPAIYRTDIHPPTFMATVLYLRDSNFEVLKFKCNVGPITNSRVKYGLNFLTHPDAIHGLVKEFVERRNASTDGANFFFSSKRWFFDKLYEQGRIFIVQRENLLPPVTSGGQNFRQIQWKLMT